MTTQTIDPSTRRVPPLGGFNLTVLGIELKRMLRNRRTIIFTLIFPAALLLVFGGQEGWQDTGRVRQRRGVHPDLDGACTARHSPRPQAAPWWPSSARWGGRASCA